MKTILSLLLLFVGTLCGYGQTINIYRQNSPTPTSIPVAQIDSITFSLQASGISCPGTPTVIYAGKTYNTVQIGSQCWLRENLDVGTRIDGSQDQANNGTIEKHCYDNNPANCNTYGGLYQWDEAMQYVTTEGAQGICPTGWHIPTMAEFNTLINSTPVHNDGNALKAIGQGTGAGAGTNESGFSALLAGFRSNIRGFVYLGTNALVWSSTEYDAAYAHYLDLDDHDGGIYLGNGHEDVGFSVRCLKD